VRIGSRGRGLWAWARESAERLQETAHIPRGTLVTGPGKKGRRGKVCVPLWGAEAGGRCVRTTARPWPSTAASFGRFPRSWAPPQTHAGTATPRDAKKRSKRARRFGHRPKDNRAHTREKAGTVRDPNGRSRLFESQERQKLETQTVKGGIDNHHARSMVCLSSCEMEKASNGPQSCISTPTAVS
jgi:hypothetical protein